MSETQTIDPLCVSCGSRKSVHVSNENGVLVCPHVLRYFNPCKHEHKSGSGWVGSDGSGGSDMTCDVCGERFVT